MSIIDAVAARVAGCAHGCATTCEVPCEVRSEAPARVRARARGELVHGCGRRVEVGVAGVAPGGVRRVPAASGLDRPSRLGREPLKDSAWTWRTVNGRLWGSVLGLAPARGTAHTAPGGLDRLGSGRRAGLSRRRPPAPAAPGVFAFFFAIPGFRRACDATVPSTVHVYYDYMTTAPFVPGVEAPQLDREREYGSETRTTTGGRTAHQTGQQCIRGPGNP